MLNIVYLRLNTKKVKQILYKENLYKEFHLVSSNNAQACCTNIMYMFSVAISTVIPKKAVMVNINENK